MEDYDSPKRRGRPRKHPLRSPSKCKPLLRNACKTMVGCSWIKKHAGKNNSIVSPFCRKVRGPKKTPSRSPSRGSGYSSKSESVSAQKKHLSQFTVVQLKIIAREVAKQEGLKGYHNLPKKKLIDLIVYGRI
jgi:hypothetical protein